jgi:MFS family permease
VRGQAHKHYVLSMLALVYMLSCLDRGLIILLLQPIKEDLLLSDTQLGFLTGIAFGLFYAVLGLPIARWADRGNRVTIASLAIGLWGLTVMACVAVTSFVQMVAARVAAAVGEAGCMPASYSLLGDYFPGSAERPRAMAIYMLASPAALLVSFVLGGWINEQYGWRVAFLVAGIPGVLIAAFVKLTVAEPRARPAAVAAQFGAPPPGMSAGESPRGEPPFAPGSRRRPIEPAPLPRMADVLSVLWHQRSTRHLTLAIILLWTMGMGLSPWYAAFMMRSHGMGTSELGVWLGLIFGLGGIAGTFLGGHIAARWLAENERAQMRWSAVMVAAIVPCFVLFLLLPGKAQALAALLPLMMVFSFFVGPTFAVLQRLVPDEMRATTLAVVMLLANLIGMGLGPQAVGVLSDLLTPRFGADSLRYSMLLMSATALWAAWHFWRVGRTVMSDLGASP